MGRIVINETENKQTVILNDSPTGVDGGYFDAQMEWHSLGEGISEIKVNIGKGRTDTDIVDDPNRALTDPIPINVNKEYITVQEYAPMGYRSVILFSTGENTVTTKAYGNLPLSYVGSTRALPTWTDLSYSGVIVDKEPNNGPIVLPDISSISNGYIRFMFKNGEEGNTPITDVINGYVMVDDVLYHLRSDI
jgi:hypothetical protein